MKTLTLIDGQEVAAIGQGTWHIGEQPGERKREVAAQREGIELGMTLIDTAEMYAEGGAEDVVGAAIAGRREEVFLVSKVYPHNASRKGLPAACERSLRRLGCETIDLYLLHWQGRYPLEETIEAFERLRDQGKILRWGVSNFDLGDMYELDGSACAANQVMYNLEERGIEYDLLPWCQERGMPVMAYCPVGQGGRLLRHPALGEIAARHDASSAQVALAWLLEQGVIAIPKAVTSAHIRQNAAAADLELSADDLRALDQAFPHLPASETWRSSEWSTGETACACFPWPREYDEVGEEIFKKE
ncbi:oxidoreductase [Pseudomonas aeruginosa]|nr:oxidoreductase [Pseudomonas aeruginosa]